MTSSDSKHCNTKWDRWSKNKTNAVAIGFMVIAIVSAVFGGIYYGYESYASLAINGAPKRDFRAAGAVITAWAVTLIFAGIAGYKLFHARNSCRHSHESMCEWNRVALSSMVFIVLYIFFPFFLWSVSPLAAFLAMFIAAFVSIVYIRRAYSKLHDSWAGAFWTSATFTAVVFTFYTLSFTFQLVANL